MQRTWVAYATPVPWCWDIICQDQCYEKQTVSVSVITVAQFLVCQFKLDTASAVRFIMRLPCQFHSRLPDYELKIVYSLCNLALDLTPSEGYNRLSRVSYCLLTCIRVGCQSVLQSRVRSPNRSHFSWQTQTGMDVLPVGSTSCFSSSISRPMMISILKRKYELATT